MTVHSGTAAALATRDPRNSRPVRRWIGLCMLATMFATVCSLVSAPPGAGAAANWETIAPMGSERKWPAAATLGGRMYVAGGTSSREDLSSVEAYDPETRSWAPSASMNVARSGHALVAGNDGRLYAIGGQNALATGPVSYPDMEVYYPTANTWQPIWAVASTTGQPVRLTGRVGVAAVTAPDGRIYAMGGMKDVDTAGTVSTPTRAVEVYDPAQPSLGWLPKASMINARSDFGAAVGSDGRIYAVGGASANPALVEAYDPETDSWSAVAPMPHPRTLGPRAVADGAGRVYVLAGYWGMPGQIQQTRAVDVYQPPTGNPVNPGNTWIAGPGPGGQVPEGGVPPMPMHREEGAAAFGPDGQIYSIGGGFGTAILNSVDTYNTTPPAPRTTPADFDGNGSTEVSVFRPSDGVWHVKDGATLGWGANGDVPVPADYDGDGDADVAVFRPSNGVWYLANGSAIAFGANGDVPVPADYDGDGDADVAVFRPSNGVWYVNGGSTTPWGGAGDIPVPADYDGDGDADIAVFRPSNGVWYVNGGAAASWGASGDIPVPADYNGDGDTDVAVFRPSNGVWYVNGGTTAGWGASGDVPVPGDYDADGDADIAVFRPSNGAWYVSGGLSTAWGVSGDIPLPIPAAIRGAAFG